VAARYEEAILVRDRDRHKGQIQAIGRNRVAIHGEQNLRCFTCGLDRVRGPRLALLVGHHLQLTWRVHDLIPAQAVFKRLLLLASERRPVQK